MPDWLLPLIGQVFVAGAVYGAIRSDIKRGHEMAQDAKDSAKEAHGRIDDILKGCKHG